MITYHNGDLLKSGCDIIAHQVNLQGFMGGGLALQIATKYPKTKKEYENFDNKQLGNICFTFEENVIIANCFSQALNFETDYSAVKSCFENIKDFASQFDIKTIGVPFNYGCGIAKGQWLIVEYIFKEIFGNEENIDFQIWKLREVYNEN